MDKIVKLQLELINYFKTIFYNQQKQKYFLIKDILSS